MIEIKKLKHPDDLADAYEIRKIVFTNEQWVDSELDLDGLDEIAYHLVAYLDNKAVGTARFRILEDKIAKIERVASLKEVRGKGVGRAIMLELERNLRELMIEKAVMDAQVSAREFYVKLGYVSEGEEFIEADISHIKMFKELK